MAIRVKVAMLGAGFIGQMHCMALHDVSILRLPTQIIPELVAIADTNESSAKEMQQRFGWKKTYTDWKEMLDNEEIDVFFNTAPNYMHREPSVYAAEKGIDVFCEKPLAPNAGEAYQAWKDVDATGVNNMTAFMWRSVPAIRLMREMVQSGELGEVLHFRSTFLINHIEPDGTITWRFSRKIAGTGALGDLGSHHIDVARFCLGQEVSKVGAIMKSTTKDAAGKILDVNDDSVICAAEFENGMPAIFEASRVARTHAHTARIEIDGTKKSLSFEMERLNELSIREPHKGLRTMFVLRPENDFSEMWLPVSIQGAFPHGYNNCFAFQDYQILAANKGVEKLGAGAATFKDAYCVAETVDTIERSANESKFLEVNIRK